MRRRAFLAAAPTAALALAGCPGLEATTAPTPTSDPESPEDAVRTFYATGRRETKVRLVHTASESFEYVQHREDTVKEGTNSNVFQPNRVQSVTTVEEHRESAIVRVSYESGSCDANCPTYVENVTLKRAGEKWRLYDAEKVSGFPDSPTSAGPSESN